jgi:hypothetical protein
MPAFSLLVAPVVLPVHLRRDQNAPLPPNLFGRARSFGARLEPRYVVGAESLDQ